MSVEAPPATARPQGRAAEGQTAEGQTAEGQIGEGRADAGPRYVDLRPGDRFPAFAQRSGEKAAFAFDTLAGRYQLYCFFLDEADPVSNTALQAMEAHRGMFDLVSWMFLGVSIKADDVNKPRLASQRGVRFINDLDFSVSSLCGAFPHDADPGKAHPARRFWMVVDPTLHVLKVFPFQRAGDHSEVFAFVCSLPPPAHYGGRELPAPIIVLPNVLEPELCSELISIYQAEGGSESGVIRDGKGVLDSGFKKRQDVTIPAGPVRQQLVSRIFRRVTPEIDRLFFMKINAVERYIVARYAAEDGGHFGPHRDNNPGITAHRRYALSINLTDDFEGGEVTFPEYSMHGYKAQAGWAIVFPCAVLHQVNPVRAGARYAFLPFLYDEGGRRIFEQTEEARRLA